MLDHFQAQAVLDEALNSLRQTRPDPYEKVGTELAKLSGIEYLTAESFEARLAQKDVLGEDTFARYRPILLKVFRMDHEPTEFVSNEDTRHLPYATALIPGWVAIGKKHDVPKNATYVGDSRNLRLGAPC